MATIYLSSTYEDLKEYRTAVYEVLRKIGHEVKAMEDHVAADQRPVEKCLADVEEADIYVGLFAFRYGYVPPAHHKNPQWLVGHRFGFPRLRIASEALPYICGEGQHRLASHV